MTNFLSKYWWLFLVRGLLAIAFGIMAFVNPAITLAALVIVWGAYALADGVVSLYGLITGGTETDDRWLVGLQGLIGVAAGLITLFKPGITALGLLLFIAAWSLATGVLQIVTAIRLRKEITGEFWMALSGLISVLFAFFILASPEAGALAVVWIIGSYALIFGIFLVAFAFRMKGKAGSARPKAA
ncbi:MAG: HdeD family acid-resistance protein [Hyphomicrobiales bacterium]